MKFKKLHSEPKTQKESQPLVSDKTAKRIRRFFILLGIVVGLTSIFYVFYFTAKFFDKYAFAFQSPITIQSPVLVLNREEEIEKVIEAKVKELTATESAKVIPTPTPDRSLLNFNIIPKAYADSGRNDVEIINQHEHAGILWKIYTLESSAGKNDGCKDEGKFNGYGYGQSTFAWNCFASFEEVTGKVNAWLTKRFDEGLDLPTALCYYNEGVKRSDCPYYQKFLTI